MGWLHREELLARARAWVERNECPLPVDLVAELLDAGLDAQAIETQLLEES